jgi:hypothetical protein
MMWRGENSCPYQDLNSDPSAAQPIASCYTNCTTLAPRSKVVVSIKVNKISEENISYKNASDEYFREMQVEGLNCFVIMLGCSQMKLPSIAKINRISYGKRRVAQTS